MVNANRKIGKALAQALAESDAACAWAENYHLKQHVVNLGKKISTAYRRTYAKYNIPIEKYNDPDDIARKAIRWFWIAQKYSQLIWLEWEAGEHAYSKSLKGNDKFAAFLKAGNDGDTVCVLYNGTGDAAEIDGKYPNETLLDGIALTWFCKADDLMAAGKTIEALDVLADAFSATELAHGEYSSNLAKGAESWSRSEDGKYAADARHSQPGGSRDKRESIRAIWASGKYTSRSLCAEQECAALDMSYDSARKALRNTPPPLT